MARKSSPEIPHAPQKAARPALRSHPSAPGRDERLAEIEEIIARLSALRGRERDAVLAGAYRAAIDRLEALAYRTKKKPETHVLGLPTKGAAPPPAPEPPQRTLPLGAVSVS